MSNWLTCTLTGRHEYTVWCENGSMFLRCSNCGRRSQGWQVAQAPQTGGAAPAMRREAATPARRLSIVDNE